MAATKASPKPGPKPRSDARERNRTVQFRLKALHPYFDERSDHAGRTEIAQRELHRYWTLTDHLLRQSSMVPADVERLGREVMRNDVIMEGTVSPVLATFVNTLAVDMRTKSLIDLSVPDAIALLDLYARAADPTAAAEILADLQGA